MIVSEAYLRIDRDTPDPLKREIGVIVLRIAETAGQEFFSKYDATILGEAVIEDGSSKFRARVRTSAKLLLWFVGGYGTIRAGVDYLRDDGKAAAGWMAAHIRPSLPDDPDATRRRAPASTRLRRLFERVESGELTSSEAAARAEDILREYREEPETIAAVVSQLRQEFASVQPAQPVQRERQPRLFIDRRPSPIRPGKRLSVFRDPRTGQIRYVEE